jgi:3-hydroxyacyl-CoA dehydrogenase
VGRAKSATFRTADVVGLDTLAHVSASSYEKGEMDEQQEMFEIPDFLHKMIEQGKIGQKSKAGFYKKEGKEILSIDLDTLEYSSQKKVRFNSIRNAKSYITPGERMKALFYGDDAGAAFFREAMMDTLIYAANRIPEIADDIVNIDRAIRWGFGWELGPFESWDAIGVDRSVKQMEQNGKDVPVWIKKMLANGDADFYKKERKRMYYYSIIHEKYKQVKQSSKNIEPKLSGKKISKNWGGSIYDIGDGVAFFDLHSVLQPQMNPIDSSIMDMLMESLSLIEKNGLKGLIVGSLGANFSAGANLHMVLGLAKAKKWQAIEQVSKSLQDITQALKYAPFPVVSAPFNITLGGGFETAAGSDRIVASAELYCGAVEVGVGLIPGGGGNLRVLENFIDAMSKGRPGAFPPLQKT